MVIEVRLAVTPGVQVTGRELRGPPGMREMSYILSSVPKMCALDEMLRHSSI